jgi:hypothetical protein
VALSHDVNLPRSHVPVWPDLCVVCCHAVPTERLRIATHSIGWWTVAFWHPGRRVTVEVPTCPACRRTFAWRRRGRIALGVVLALAAGVAGIWIVGSGPHGRKWLAMGVAVLLILPFSLWEVFFPPPIEITAYAKTTDYEFRDADYAEEFARLNNADVT